jgi:hypothetical protein
MGVFMKEGRPIGKNVQIRIGEDRWAKILNPQ